MKKKTKKKQPQKTNSKLKSPQIKSASGALGVSRNPIVRSFKYNSPEIAKLLSTQDSYKFKFADIKVFAYGDAKPPGHVDACYAMPGGDPGSYPYGGNND